MLEVRPCFLRSYQTATLQHGARAFFSDRILPKLHSAEPFSAEYLRSVADRYRAAAPDMVGEIPFVIECFIAEYGSPRSSIVEHETRDEAQCIPIPHLKCNRFCDSNNSLFRCITRRWKTHRRNVPAFAPVSQLHSSATNSKSSPAKIERSRCLMHRDYSCGC